MFKNWSLKIKLISICTLLSLFTAITGALAYLGLKDTSRKYSHIAMVSMPRAIALSAMQGDFRRVRGYQNLLLANGISEAEQSNVLSEIKKSVESYQQINKEFSEMPFSEGEKSIYEEVNHSWNEFNSLVNQSMDLAESKNPRDRERLIKMVLIDSKDIGKKVNDTLHALISSQTKESKKWVSTAEQGSQAAQWTILLVNILGFAIAQIIGILFSRTLSTQLQGLANRLGQGAEHVAKSATSVSEAGAELSSGATEQAAALQETVASLDEVSAMVSKNADNAKSSQALSETSQSSAIKGKEVVDEMIRSIDEINTSNTEIMEQIENSNREISEIVKVISEIGNKTKVINDIVFQTKLLSFNASVEAARAGEHGKGFAVVAEEVGNLAAMSGNASKEISTMLEGSIQKVESIVNHTRSRVERLVTTGKEKVTSGTETARRCGQVLDEIVSQVSKVSQMIGEIATACSEQAHGVQEISKAMGQLDQLTQRSADASRQSAEAVKYLATESDDLRKLVQSLVVTVHGANHSHSGSSDENITVALNPEFTNNVTPIRGKAESRKSASR